VISDDSNHTKPKIQAKRSVSPFVLTFNAIFRLVPLWASRATVAWLQKQDVKGSEIVSNRPTTDPLVGCLDHHQSERNEIMPVSPRSTRLVVPSSLGMHDAYRTLCVAGAKAEAEATRQRAAVNFIPNRLCGNIESVLS